MIEYKPEYDNFVGEMLPFERRFLYKYIVDTQPNIVFEIGSGSGGSTRIILSALNDLDKGYLYNCDPYSIAASHIEDVDTSRMTFNQIPGYHMIGQLYRQSIIPDFVFFDGPEDEFTSENDFRIMDTLALKGCMFIMHDWELRQRIDGNKSIKSIGARRYLQQAIGMGTWEVVEELSGVEGEYPNINGYNSVGMICARKIT